MSEGGVARPMALATGNSTPTRSAGARNRPGAIGCGTLRVSSIEISGVGSCFQRSTWFNNETKLVASCNHYRECQDRFRGARMKRKTFAASACPVARSLDVIGEWWSLLIVRDALMV